MRETLIELSLQKLFKDRYIIRTSSGTSSLIAILKVLSEQSLKDEVILPSVACPSLLFAINFLKLKPVFIDMETSYFNMDIKDLKKKITKKTLAIIGAHCFGIANDIKAIKKISKVRNIFFIEDACLNFGGKKWNKYYGSFGDVGVISFGYDKILSVAGGGALIIKSKKIFIKIIKFLKKNPLFYKFNFKSKNFKKKFNKLEKNIKLRNTNAKKYYDNLLSKNIIKPKFRVDDVYWRYPILIKKNRDKLIKLAYKKNLIITKHYPDVSRFQSFSNLKIAKIFDKSVINIFVKEKTSEKYINSICKLINKNA